LQEPTSWGGSGPRTANVNLLSTCSKLNWIIFSTTLAFERALLAEAKRLGSWMVIVLPKDASAPSSARSRLTPRDARLE
jgi:hypothetical protein